MSYTGLMVCDNKLRIGNINNCKNQITIKRDSHMIRGYILPHPPIAVPEVGDGREKEIQETLNAFDEVAKDIAEYAPETIVLISPHSIYLRDGFYIAAGMGAHGDLAQFRAPKVSMDVAYDSELGAELTELCDEYHIPYLYSKEGADTLDHGAVVPLYFINKRYDDYSLLRVSPSLLLDETLYDMGYLIERAAAHLGRKVAIIASGDLSHKLLEDGPYGFIKEGPVFDKAVTDVMKSGRLEAFAEIDKEIAERSAQCGLNGFIMLAGALQDYKVTPKFLSYQGTFGVGYGICKFICSDWYAILAKQSLETFITKGERFSFSQNDVDFPDFMKNEKAGVFVCIKKNGQLRGCIGTILPCYENTFEEVCNLAISAGTKDPRFMPITEDELNELDYTVDVMMPPKSATKDMLDEKKYGVIVSSGNKRGLLLPNLDGVDSVDEQIAISMQKGGIKPGEPIELMRFLVERHS